MAKRKKSKNATRNFTLLVVILFFGSILGYALFARPPNSRTHHERVFLNQNIFDTPVSPEIQRDVLMIENPNLHPKIPLGRKIGGIWIEYSCANCTSLISNLTQIVNKYYPRVYISPDQNLTSQLLLLSWSDKEELNDFNKTEIENFICSHLVMPPDACALRGI